ncbi:MAG TPA: FAD-binding oxidoreductase [Candidatus Binatia bacterium]|nr:FAD-binding oxidoreductase [Candidatus Binatia bacterium]
MKTCDFLVIGAGIAGASVAYELANHGRVILLERESLPGYHSTGRSAAVLTENYGNAIIRRLTVASRQFLQRAPEGFTSSPLLSPRGVLWIAREEQRDRLTAALGEARQLVPSIHAVDCTEAKRLCPVLRGDYLAAAVLEPEAMDMDVHAIHQGFLKGFRQRRGELVTTAEVKRLLRTAHTWEVYTAHEQFAAGVVVNAAGAWCDEVGKLAGARPIGLIPKRRTAFIVDGPATGDLSAWPVVIDVDEQFYFKPESGRLLASPADETPMPPCDVYAEDYDVALAVERIERATTLLIRHIRRKWAGLRSFVADKSPVVGMDRFLPGFFWLAGQGGYGIMTSPAMARAATGLMVEGRLPADLTAVGLRPEDLSPARYQEA